VLHLLMPTFNRAHMLGRTLESVFAQTASRKDWQLTVVDNCSTDNTRALLDDYASRFENFDYTVNESNIGLFGNLNRCMDLARTPKFMIIHSDDAVEATLVEDVARFIGAHPAVQFAFGQCRARLDGGRELIDQWYRLEMLGSESRMLAPGELTTALFASGSSFIFPPTVLYDREFFRGLRYSQDYRFAADLDLWFRVAFAGASAGMIAKPLLTCEIHDGRLSATNADEMRREAIAIYRKYLEQLPEAGVPHHLSQGQLRLVRTKLHLFSIAIRLNLVPGFRARRKIAALIERSIKPHKSKGPAPVADA
jgi:glycosyltransferase involved in cell wall biosynthesis